jgi:hypothetical protein
MTKPLRFLLDQQFPKPVFDIHTLDRTVTYEHFADHAPMFSKTSTPDWMLHLIAADGGFDGVVTLDRAQLEEETELVALALARVSVVTWQHGDEDPVVLWGQLLAYMPQVLKAMTQGRPVVVTLPNPRLQPTKGVTTPRDMLGAMKQRDGIDFPQRRRRAVQIMERELGARGQEALGKPLKRTRQ